MALLEQLKNPSTLELTALLLIEIYISSIYTIYEIEYLIPLSLK